jgi:hypothetical protein
MSNFSTTSSQSYAISIPMVSPPQAQYPPPFPGPPGQAGSTYQISEGDKRNKAWKYYGYQNFCKFMASDNDFFLLRRFGDLNARILLKMQFEISRLERRLQELENNIMESLDDKQRNDSFHWDERSQSGPMFERKRLLDILQPRLKDYSEFLDS